MYMTQRTLHSIQKLSDVELFWNDRKITHHGFISYFYICNLFAGIISWKVQERMLSVSDVRPYFTVPPLVNTLRKLSASTVHLAIHVPQIQTFRGKWRGWMPHPLDTVTMRCCACTRVSVRQMQMANAFIRHIGDRRSQEKSQITGCGRFTGTIEMWVM